MDWVILRIPAPPSSPAECASVPPFIRTLALEPDILLLDEPFSALDYQTRLSVCDDISTIIRGRHKTAILITHDLSEAVSVADRIIILSKRPEGSKEYCPSHFPHRV